MDLMWIPVYNSWRLNERHYGALQGLNKVAMVDRFGAEQVQLWRRSYDVRPPDLRSRTTNAHPPKIPVTPASTRRTSPWPSASRIRSRAFFPTGTNTIAPAVQSGQRVIVTAHGNSMRALVKYLDNMPDEEIVALNIPTGIPLVYEFNDDLSPIRHYYLGDPEAINKAVQAVANQTSKKK